MSYAVRVSPSNDSRELRAQLEAAQGEVKRLNRALEQARAPRPEVAKLEVTVAELKQSRRDLEAHWKERERDWHMRERMLRDQAETAKKHAARVERLMDLALARVEKLEARPSPPGLIRTLEALLADPSKEKALHAAKREIAKLERQLNLAHLGKRR